jgi:hypothetical protein
LYLTPCGKSMLAQPFAGLLRPMTVEEALQGKEIDTHNRAGRRRRRQISQYRSRATGLERALYPSGAEGRAHHRRPGRRGYHADGPRGRGGAVPAGIVRQPVITILQLKS